MDALHPWGEQLSQWMAGEHPWSWFGFWSLADAWVWLCWDSSSKLSCGQECRKPLCTFWWHSRALCGPWARLASTILAAQHWSSHFTCRYLPAPDVSIERWNFLHGDPRASSSARFWTSWTCTSQHHAEPGHWNWSCRSASRWRQSSGFIWWWDECNWFWTSIGWASRLVCNAAFCHWLSSGSYAGWLERLWVYAHGSSTWAWDTASGPLLSSSCQTRTTRFSWCRCWTSLGTQTWRHQPWLDISNCPSRCWISCSSAGTPARSRASRCEISQTHWKALHPTASGVGRILQGDASIMHLMGQWCYHVQIQCQTNWTHPWWLCACCSSTWSWPSLPHWHTLCRQCLSSRHFAAGTTW